MRNTILPKPCFHGTTPCQECGEDHERHDTEPAPPPSMTEYQSPFFPGLLRAVNLE